MALMNSLPRGATPLAVVNGINCLPVEDNSLWVVQQDRTSVVLQAVSASLPLSIPPAQINISNTVISRNGPANTKFKARKIVSTLRYHYWDSEDVDLAAYPCTVSSSFEIPLSNIPLTTGWIIDLVMLSVGHLFSSNGTTLFDPVATLSSGLPVHPGTKHDF